MSLKSLCWVSTLVLSLVTITLGQSSPPIAPTPGQPHRNDAPIGTFEIVGDSIASAQQLFLGTLDKVYIVDKTERNPTQMNGHPVWAAEYSLSSNKGRPMDVVTNSFCAGGNVLGNGTWINIGGNQAVTWGGLQALSQNGGGPYDDPDGGQSVRLLNPCDDSSCDWQLTTDMTTRRWYPTIETLQDGSVIVIGGCDWGGYVNSASQNNPTYEFFPPTNGATPVNSPFLENTLPANLYPLTWLLPSGKLFMQATYSTTLLDYKSGTEYKLPNMPHAVRTYPASAGTAILPLTPANNWTATLLFCGGSSIAANKFTLDWDIASFPASDSCVSITPDVASNYTEEESLPQGRSMGNMILLPDGRIFMFNGAATGTAGYGNDSWAIGQSYADNPVLQPLMYDASKPMGQRWSQDGLSNSTIPRMYHSGGTLLPDGSVFVSGSNPNADYTVGPGVKYPTEYRVEIFYPSYYNQRRPQPQGLLAQLAYGGPYFNVSLTSDDLFGDAGNVVNTTVVVIRTGFSTHGMNMGHRLVQLESTYTASKGNNSAILHVSQLPPNPAIIAPGPALLFVVVNGVPSVGVEVMIGSGQIENQQIRTVAPLPSSSMVNAASTNSDSGSQRQSHKGGVSRTFTTSDVLVVPVLLWAFVCLLL